MKHKKGYTAKKRHTKRAYAPKTRALTLRTNVKSGLGFPRRMCTTLKYVHTGSISCTLPAIGKFLFYTNGLYTPAYTGGSHQPMYFDQYMSIYNHYHVIGARIRVNITNYGTTGNWICGLMINDDPTVTPSTPQGLAEANTGKWKILRASTSSSGSNSVTLYEKWSARKNWGKGILANTSLTGDASSNPSEAQFFQIFAAPVSDISAETVEFTAEIDYITVFNELKDLTSS